ncbi:MAG: M20/M25/M40 family metallo-hydrolase [Zestosphaera sp.]
MSCLSEDVLDLLASLVSVDTTNDPVRGLKPGRAVIDLVEDLLRGWGLDASLLEVNGYYTIYGEVGRGEPLIMFMAHLDVVPAVREEWTHDPFKLTVVGDKAFGRGVADDKGNVVGVMLALKRLNEQGLRGRVLYAFTTDEEVGGIHGAKALAEKLAKENSLPKYLINCDGSLMSPIVRRRKSFKALVKAARKTVKVSGALRKVEFEVRTPVTPTRHAAYFIPGVDTHPFIAASHFMRSNPWLLATRVEGTFVKSNVLPSKVMVEYADPSGEGGEVEADVGLTEVLHLLMPLSRTPVQTSLHSDYGVTITPNMYYLDGEGRHVVEVDVRAMTNETGVVREALERVASEVAPEVSLEVRGERSSGCLYLSPDDGLVKTSLKLLESMGVRASPVEGAGASDSRYFTPLGVKSMDFGPKGGNVHGPDEWVDINTLRLLPRFYVGVARELMSLPD